MDCKHGVALPRCGFGRSPETFCVAASANALAVQERPGSHPLGSRHDLSPTFSVIGYWGGGRQNGYDGPTKVKVSIHDTHTAGRQFRM